MGNEIRMERALAQQIGVVAATDGDMGGDIVVTAQNSAISSSVPKMFLLPGIGTGGLMPA